MSGTAEISPCGRYRYVLRRRWTDYPSHNKTAVFVMLNPSTADASKDDPTIRKCVGFAKRWGLDGIAVVNLFAWRSPNPGDLLLADEPIGPENDKWISEVTSDPHASVFAAWGSHGEIHRARVRAVCALIPAAMRCLALSMSGQPRHPLMLSYKAVPQPWERPC